MSTEKHIDNLRDQAAGLPVVEDFIGFLRNAVCEAIDQTVEQHGAGKLLDEDLPELFRAVDALAQKLFQRGFE